MYSKVYKTDLTRFRNDVQTHGLLNIGSIAELKLKTCSYYDTYNGNPYNSAQLDIIYQSGYTIAYQFRCEYGSQNNIIETIKKALMLPFNYLISNENIKVKTITQCQNAFTLKKVEISNPIFFIYRYDNLKVISTYERLENTMFELAKEYKDKNIVKGLLKMCLENAPYISNENYVKGNYTIMVKHDIKLNY